MAFASLTPTADSGTALFPDGTTPAPDMATAVRGAISLATPPGRLAFRFAYGEVPVTGTITPTGESRYVLSIAVTAGIVPYSAEDRDARGVLLAAIHHIARSFDDRIAIDPHQAIVISAAREVAVPLTAVSVLAGLVALMVEVRPVFEALGDYLPELRSALPVADANAA